MNKLLVCFFEQIMCVFAIGTGFLGRVLCADVMAKV